MAFLLNHLLNLWLAMVPPKRGMDFSKRACFITRVGNSQSKKKPVLSLET